MVGGTTPRKAEHNDDFSEATTQKVVAFAVSASSNEIIRIDVQVRTAFVMAFFAVTIPEGATVHLSCSRAVVMEPIFKKAAQPSARV